MTPLVVYVGVCIAVAASRDYVRNVNTVREVFAAVLAVVSGRWSYSESTCT